MSREVIRPRNRSWSQALRPESARKPAYFRLCDLFLRLGLYLSRGFPIKVLRVNAFSHLIKMSNTPFNDGIVETGKTVDLVKSKRHTKWLGVREK
jgi:hypothetical protein